MYACQNGHRLLETQQKETRTFTNPMLGPASIQQQSIIAGFTCSYHNWGQDTPHMSYSQYFNIFNGHGFY